MSSSDLEILLLLTFCPLCPSHISPSDRALICSTFSQQSGLPNNAMTKKIWKLSCGNLCQPEGLLCKGLSATFSRVSSEWLGMARVPPPPSSAYWPPHSHVRFFSDNTSEPVLVGQQPPPSLLSHRLSQEEEAGGGRLLPHTHTHTWATVCFTLLSLELDCCICQEIGFSWPRKSSFLWRKSRKFLYGRQG